MTIVFVSNFFNHHQKPVADELYKLTDGEYRFIETSEITEGRLKLGFPQYNVPYTLKYKDDPVFSQQLIDEAEVVIAGGADACKYVRERINKKKLTFEYSERLFKSPKNYLKIPVYAYHAWKTKGAYMLSASAFTAGDYASFGMFRGKCFKWGYFPEVKYYPDIDKLIAAKSQYYQKVISILWAARLRDWKHPEAAIYLAKRLKDEGQPFQLNIIGRGEKEKWLQKQIAQNHLDEFVHLLGSMPPEQVRLNMEKSDIFLFTSDRNEGWGAVLNESMNSACAVVASHAIGSVPFLIKNKENGLIFRSEDWKDLYSKVHWLISNPDSRCQIQKEAYKTITQVWSAENAARKLLILIDELKHNKHMSMVDGPCSIAPVLMNKWLGK